MFHFHKQKDRGLGWEWGKKKSILYFEKKEGLITSKFLVSGFYFK